MNYILSNDINERCSGTSKNDKKLRESLLYSFTRLCKLAPKESNFSVINTEFNDFVADMFYSIQKTRISLENYISPLRNVSMNGMVVHMVIDVLT